MPTSDSLTRSFDALRVRLHYVNRAWTVDKYDALLGFFVRIVPRLMNAERFGVFIVEQERGRVISTAGTGLTQGQIDAPIEGSIVGRAISSGECVIENGLAEQSGYHQVADSQTGFITRSILCAPIKRVAGGGIAGAVQVLNKGEAGGFTQDDARLAQEVADYLAMAIENILLNREILKLSDQLNREIAQLPPTFGTQYLGPSVFVAHSQAMQEVLELVRLVSDTPVSVLIQGENGTGKEVIARMIHERGERAKEPFVAVNCAAVPETLVESEFFGYERGAFTGATGSRPGRFEEAEGGTLFLDEVADLPINVQPKLLRALQESEGSRLGSNRVIPYDLRLISASNRSLNALVEQQAFREDLYYRLFAVEIVVPPLRERREDIAPLALAFLDEFATRFGKTLPGFTEELIEAFEAYRWPGNVRQLRREVERLVALSPPSQHLSLERASKAIRAQAESGDDPVSLNLPARVESLERQLIRQALTDAEGNKLRAAALLGITRQGLHKKLKRWSIGDGQT